MYNLFHALTTILLFLLQVQSCLRPPSQVYLSLDQSQSYQAETGTETAVPRLSLPTAFIPAPIKSPLGPIPHL